jgi:hypothetical protein
VAFRYLVDAPADVGHSPKERENCPTAGLKPLASKLMIERTLAQRVRMSTPLGGAPKKAGAHWKRSDTILSGSRPQTLLYGPHRGRWADQGEWSEGRTSEEDSAPHLEGEVQGEAQVDAPVEVQGEAQIEVEIVRPAFGS